MYSMAVMLRNITEFQLLVYQLSNIDLQHLKLSKNTLSIIMCISQTGPTMNLTRDLLNQMPAVVTVVVFYSVILTALTHG